MRDVSFTAQELLPAPGAADIAADLLPDLDRLAVLLHAVEALASGAASLSDDGPLDQIEALASLMGGRVGDMRARLDGLSRPAVPPAAAAL